MLAKDRQSEFERASAAEVARSAQEVQFVAEQQRVTQLTAQLQEAATQTQVSAFRDAMHQHMSG